MMTREVVHQIVQSVSTSIQGHMGFTLALWICRLTHAYASNMRQSSHKIAFTPSLQRVSRERQLIVLKSNFMIFMPLSIIF